MPYRFSLAYLTVMEVQPPEAVRIAAACGYQHVGLRLLPAGTEAPFPIMGDKVMLRETQQALADTGVTVADIEIVRIGANFDPHTIQAFLERGAELGAKHILVAGDDADLGRCADNFASFCELAAQYQLTADLEFMPWTGVKNLRDAQQVLETAQHPNGFILIDALHFGRSATTLAEVVALDSRRVNYVQFCDAPFIANPTTEQLIHTARAERLLPGEGDIDVRGLLQAIPRDTVLSLEIPQRERAKTVSALQRAKEAIVAMQGLIAEANRKNQP